MRLRLPRGRTGLVLGALLAAMLVPAAVSAAGPGHGQLTPAVPAPSPSSAGRTGGQAPDIYLVQLASGADTFRQQAKAVGLNYSERFAYKSLFNGVSIRINPNDVGKLAGIASVSNVYPAHFYTLGPVTTADPELATAIQMTGADVAQAAGWTGKGVKVAVMDTGIDLDHADLGGDGVAGGTHVNSRVVSQWDFVGDDYNADPESPGYNPVPSPDAVADDCNGHGTHVAGIVGANGHGQTGHATGVAPDVSFGAYRVFGCDGSVTDDVMLAAMERIKADGADVMNMSIGDAFNNWAGSPTAKAADALVDAGIVVVASIGNSGGQGIYSAGAPGRRRQGDRRRVVRQYPRPGTGLPGVSGRNGRSVQRLEQQRRGDPGSAEPADVGNRCGQADGRRRCGRAGAAERVPGGTTFPDGCAAFPAGYFTGRSRSSGVESARSTSRSRTRRPPGRSP